jgi:hypothetical protein
MLTKVKSYDSFQYLEVWKVTKMVKGCVKETERTGKFIQAEDMPNLRPGWMTSSVSLKLQSREEFEIDVVPADSFK